jgi:hypothetical protein
MARLERQMKKNGPAVLYLGDTSLDTAAFFNNLIRWTGGL